MGRNARYLRVVLLFDTHEAFFGEAIADPGALVHADYLMRDEWLRSLLGHLPLEAGVVVVVAGRTRPPWGSAPVAAIPEEFVDSGQLATWPPPEALDYLEKAGVEDEQLRQALADYARWGRARCTRISWACARMWRWPRSAAAVRLDPASFAGARGNLPASSWIWRGDCWPGCRRRWSTASWR